MIRRMVGCVDGLTLRVRVERYLEHGDRGGATRYEDDYNLWHNQMLGMPTLKPAF